MPEQVGYGSVYGRCTAQDYFPPHFARVAVRSGICHPPTPWLTGWLTDWQWRTRRYEQQQTKFVRWNKLEKFSEISCHQWVVKFKETDVLEWLKISYQRHSLLLVHFPPTTPRKEFNRFVLRHSELLFQVEEWGGRNDNTTEFLRRWLRSIINTVCQDARRGGGVNCMQAELFHISSRRRIKYKLNFNKSQRIFWSTTLLNTFLLSSFAPARLVVNTRYLFNCMR